MPDEPRQIPEPASSEAPLPPELAFVVQLRSRAQGDGEIFVGRIEHIATGAAARFTSAATLLAFIADFLGASRPSTRSEEEAR